MGVVFYLGGCTICGAAAAWMRARGLPFAIEVIAEAASEER